MDTFFRFPQTPHLAWLGDQMPRDDKLLSAKEHDALLSGIVHVEEKLDGANLGISLAGDSGIRVQNRGQYLSTPWNGQFSRLGAWLAEREDALANALGPGLILFGEWCAARHTVTYEALPDWFLAFDIYDLVRECFWSRERLRALCTDIGITEVPYIGAGHWTLGGLARLVENQKSAFGAEPVEGLVIRLDEGGWLKSRAKLVRPKFTQSMGEHWSHRTIQWNSVRSGG